MFSDGDLGAALRAHISKAVQAVDNIAEGRFSHQSDAEIAQEILVEFAVRPLELREQHRSMSRSEIKFDVSRDPSRNVFRRPGPIYVNGIQIVVSTPFLGDPGLWKLRPNQYSSVFPTGNVRGDGVDAGTLEIVMERTTDVAPEEIKRDLEREFQTIRTYVANQKQQIESELRQLEPRVLAAVAERRKRLEKHSDLADILGIPLAQSVNRPLARPAQLVRPVKKLESRAAKRDVEWDVFVSHASEDKESCARPLAEALRAAGYNVWFDAFTLTVGDSLRRSIDRGLAKSRFGVVVISPAFLSKEWPQKELDGLVAREVNGLKVILPVWHNISREAVVAASPILADRLATSSTKGLELVVAELIAAMSGER